MKILKTLLIISHSSSLSLFLVVRNTFFLFLLKYLLMICLKCLCEGVPFSQQYLLSKTFNYYYYFFAQIPTPRNHRNSIYDIRRMCCCDL